MPFAFATLASSSNDASPVPPAELLKEVNSLVRSQIGAIASLGGLLIGKGIIPKTRSGKTLRRVLRELIENAVAGDFDKEVNVPATVEDAGVVDAARAKIREYFETRDNPAAKAKL